MRAILILIAALAANAQDNKEAAAGAQLAKNIRERTTAIEKPILQEYVERAGNKLAAEIPNRNFSYTFALIADDLGGETHEPLSLPGGYIFVSAALIRSAASEGEFAGMLSHAMVHPTLPRVQLNGSTMPLVFISGWNGLGAAEPRSLLPMSLFKRQRENELQADTQAVSMMSAAGFDPEALLSYIARVPAKQLRGATSQQFATLPDRDTRVAAVQQAIQELPTKSYPAADPDEFGRIQAQVPEPAQVQVPTLRRTGPNERPTLRR
jgi:predicted Zn-dependent protease